MPISKKLAGYLAKKIKEAPKDVEKGDPRTTKADLKEEALTVEMTKLSGAELKELAEKANYKYSTRGTKSTRSDAAMDEMDRRGLKKFLKKEGKAYDDPDHNPVYDETTGARLSDAFSASDMRKDIERRNKLAEEQGYNKGGMVKKKPAAKKAAPAKTKSRSSPYNKYYGK